MVITDLLQLVTMVPLLQFQAGVQRFDLLAQGCSLLSHLLHLHIHIPGTFVAWYEVAGPAAQVVWAAQLRGHTSCECLG